MNQLFDFVKKTGIVGISQILGNVLSYFIIVIITREFGAEGLGVYSFLLSFSALFFLFEDLGFSQLIIRDVSQKRSLKKKYFAQSLYVRLVISSISISILIAAIFVIDRPDLSLMLFLTGLYRFLSIIARGNTSFLRIDNKAQEISILNVFSRLIALTGALVASFLLNNLMIFILFLFISQLFEVVYSMYKVKGFSLMQPFDLIFIKNKLPLAVPFIFVGVFSFVFAQFDTVMLSFMEGDAITGYYNASYKLLDALQILPGLLLTFGFPSISRMYKKNKYALSFFLEKILYFLFSFMVAVSIGVYFLGNRILDFIYSISSIESFLVLQILVFGHLFAFVSIPLTVFLASAKKQKHVAIISGLCALLNVILNFILIPIYSLYGAAIATVSTYIFYFIILYYLSLRHIKLRIFRRFYVIILNSVLLILTILILHKHSVICIISTGGIVYISVLFLFEVLLDKRNYHRFSE